MIVAEMATACAARDKAGRQRRATAPPAKSICPVDGGQRLAVDGPSRPTGTPMPKRARPAQNHLSDAGALRVRAAWLYYNRGLTQNQIADQLGISRSSVIRLLEEARARGEVQIWINETPGECTALALALETRLGLDEVVIVPGSGTALETAQDVGAALGRYLSNVIADDMVVGVGWGRTLSASLRTFRPVRRQGVQVLSLMGGLVRAEGLNPIDFSWQLASHLGASCLLFLAPLIVDSAATRQRLIDDCGLGDLVARASAMDLAVISCGEVGIGSSSMSSAFLDQADLRGLIAAGAVCDCMCSFLDEAGNPVSHPLPDRVMSVGLEAVARAKHVVLASGGARRAAAIRAAIRRTGCQTLITDEAAALALMALEPGTA